MPDVYQVYSTIEPTLADTLEFFDDPENLPRELKGVEITQHNNTIKIQSIPTEENEVGQYTPTALLKGAVKERRVVVDDDGTVTHDTVQQKQQREWDPSLVYDEEESIDTTPVEYIGFKGRGNEVVCNSAVKYPMFMVLCDLAELSHRGYVEGIVAKDGELTAVRVDHTGEREPVKVTVTGDEEQKKAEQDEDEGPSVDWQKNEYI